MPSEAESWNKIVEPILAKLNAGRHFGKETVFNKEGSDALYKLLKTMADIIDNEIDNRRARDGK